jgi:hypothetical protein
MLLNFNFCILNCYTFLSGPRDVDLYSEKDEEKNVTDIKSEEKNLTDIKSEEKELTDIRSEEKKLTDIKFEEKSLTDIKSERRSAISFIGALKIPVSSHRITP